MGEVPDGAYANLHHGVGHFLCEGRRNCQNANLDIFGKGGHFIDVVNVFQQWFSDNRGIGVETGDSECRVAQTFVSEKGASEVANADLKGIGGVDAA